MKLAKIAYLITVYKQPQLFERMFTAIYDPDNVYLIHVDRKSDSSIHAGVATFLKSVPNARILRSQKISWGGWSQVKVDLAAIKHALSCSGDWEFFINLSAQDYPLMPQRQIRARLAAGGERSYVEHFSVNDSEPWVRGRLSRFCIELRGTCRVTMFRRALPGDVELHWGSSWYVLNRTACQYIANYALPKRICRILRWAYIPCEYYFQTALMNSEFRDSIVNDNLRKILWEDGKPNPKLLTEADAASLSGSNQLFARKFDETVSGRILDILQERLGSESATHA